MKTTLFVLFLLLTTAALGQSAGGTWALDSQPQVIAMPGHPQTATRQPMATERNLLGNSSYVYAQGERPLWEVGAKPVVVSLGEIARQLRKEHETAKKADKCFEN
jgi:hypothetical protein